MADLLEVAVEMVISLFGAKVRLKRLRIPRPTAKKVEPNLRTGAIGAVVIALLWAGLAGYHLVWHRKVTVVSDDGAPVVLAGFIVDSGNDEVRVRTANGKLKLRRFGVKSLRVEDVRFQPKSWPGSDIPAKLVVQRSETGQALQAVVQKVKQIEKARATNQAR